MSPLRIKAYAKLNLTLDILGKRPDGYHDLRMVMQSVDLADEVTIAPSAGKGRMSTNLSYLPADGRNLAQAAASVFRRNTGKGGPVDIAIEKHIPVCAGMGGGSSDAAAVLRAMNEMTGAGLTLTQLAEIGQQVGSDVPYCVLGGTALAEGRGEILTPLPPLPPCFVAICKPHYPISTPRLFAEADSKRLLCRPDTEGLLRALEAGDLIGVSRRLYNVFEDVLEPPRRREVDAIKAELIDCGALGASMSGSGPSVFGLFDREEPAREAVARLSAQYQDVFFAKTV